MYQSHFAGFNLFINRLIDPVRFREWSCCSAGLTFLKSSARPSLQVRPSVRQPINQLIDNQSTSRGKAIISDASRRILSFCFCRANPSEKTSLEKGHRARSPSLSSLSVSPLCFFTFYLSSSPPTKMSLTGQGALTCLPSLGEVPICLLLQKFPAKQSPLEMTFGNPSRSAGAAGDGSLEPLLFGFSSKPRGTRVKEEEEEKDEEEYRGAGCPRLQPQRRQGKQREEEERRVSYDQNQRGNKPHFRHACINIYREEDRTPDTQQIIKYLLVF